MIAVDLSNLCRDRRLLGRGTRADLDLLDRFRAGAAVAGFDATGIICVADESLRHMVSAEQRSELARMERRGDVIFSAVADARLLDMAFGPNGDPGVLVASMDNFDDFRREIPAIQGCRDRFLGWDPRGSGISVHRRDMGVHSHNRMSRKEEDELLRERRLRRTTIIDQAATRLFRCAARSCLLAQCFPAHIPELPRYDDRTESFVCPVCGEPVTAIAERPRASQLVVFMAEEEQFRILLPEGETVAVGRLSSAGCVGLASRMPEELVRAVSGRHVAFSRRSGEVLVEELGSKNGTVVQDRTGAAPDSALVPGAPRRLSGSDRVLLPAGVALELSGRSVPVDGELAPDDVAPDPNPRLTRLLTRR